MSLMYANIEENFVGKHRSETKNRLKLETFIQQSYTNIIYKHYSHLFSTDRRSHRRRRDKRIRTQQIHPTRTMYEEARPGTWRCAGSGREEPYRSTYTLLCRYYEWPAYSGRGSFI